MTILLAFVKLVVPLVGWVIDVIKVSLKFTTDCCYQKYSYSRISKTEEKKKHLKIEWSLFSWCGYIRSLNNCIYTVYLQIIILVIGNKRRYNLNLLRIHDTFFYYLNGIFVIKFLWSVTFLMQSGLFIFIFFCGGVYELMQFVYHSESNIYFIINITCLFKNRKIC